jgi:hypothetical protein
MVHNIANRPALARRADTQSIWFDAIAHFDLHLQGPEESVDGIHPTRMPNPARPHILREHSLDGSQLRGPAKAAAPRARLGRVAASLRAAGRKVEDRGYDALIGATAIAKGLLLHTVNPDDFVDGISLVVDPAQAYENRELAGPGDLILVCPRGGGDPRIAGASYQRAEETADADSGAVADVAPEPSALTFCVDVECRRGG